MRRSTFLVAISALALLSSQLQAQQIVLDEVMTKEERQKTGVDRLTLAQKVELEAWLNKNFVLKPKGEVKEKQLSLSINIDNGQKLQLSDNSIWEIDPTDVQTSSIWIIPFPVKLVPSNDPEYPCLIVNVNSGVSVKARKVPAMGQPPSSQPSPTQPAAQ